MATILRRWRQGAAGLILGGLAGVAALASAAMIGPIAGAVLRGLDAVGATPALVERSVYEDTLGEAAVLRRDLRRLRAERDRALANLEAAREKVVLYRHDLDSVRDELDDAALKLAALAASNRTLRVTLKNRSERQRNAIAQVQASSRRVSTRTARAAARNTLSLPTEFVPFAGWVAILAVTTLDLYDSCSTVQDMNEIRAAVDLPVLDDHAGDTCKWIKTMGDYIPFGAPDCQEQVAEFREQGLDEDADALAATCEES